MNLCQCGCGGLTKHRWMQGHNSRTTTARAGAAALGTQYGPITGKIMGTKYGPIYGAMYGPIRGPILGAIAKHRHRQGPKKAGQTSHLKSLLKILGY